MHSPEPWNATAYSGPAPNLRLFTILGSDGKTLCAATSGQTVEQSLANVERIVACVNFCRGIDSKHLNRPFMEIVGDSIETRQSRPFMDDKVWVEASPPASQQPG